jgi:broad-specificity NMP kinase
MDHHPVGLARPLVTQFAGERSVDATKRCRIVLTGGPGGGKTTAADLFRRELGSRVALVPESATLLFSGGFPRVKGSDAERATQVAIYRLQQSLETLQAALHPSAVIVDHFD